MTLLGNYYGTPATPVTVLAGIRNAVAPAPGPLRPRGRPRRGTAGSARDPGHRRGVPAHRTGSASGLRGEYFRGRELEGTPVLTRDRRPRGLPLGPLLADQRPRGPRRVPRGPGPRQRRLLGALDGPDRPARLRTLRADGHRRRRLPPRRRRQARDRRMDDHAAGTRAQRAPRAGGRPPLRREARVLRVRT